MRGGAPEPLASLMQRSIWFLEEKKRQQAKRALVECTPVRATNSEQTCRVLLTERCRR